ncbi:NAD-dependent epimerase/dehydratase family protein [Deinococcus knuensis]|uniref:UDP-N-acetylglucosamine 4-epimerase n=1 Tax=Deinococcus knuensis TaxID=1837380 RepID=A0ABQ2SFD7_9DEIO|nr:NAD-dependent epimerase/dehydratase family protein [Deinococcus knuensis]GGS26100.1 UDP-N-acetylglucosamine 4-epimerase [Deinococcus knuensis]
METNSEAWILTGGSGFIGQHLIKYLLEITEIKIINIDIVKNPIEDERILDINIDILRLGEISIPHGLNISKIIHLAALAKEPGYQWEEYFRTNAAGTLEVIKLAERIDCKEIIFTSTMMVFRASESQKLISDIKDGDTAYGISKSIAEEELIKWEIRGDGRKLLIIRPGVVFGAGEGANFTRMIKSSKKGRFFFIGRKSTIKGCIYVKELVNIISHYHSSCGSNIVHAVYPQQYSISDIYESISRVYGINKPAYTLSYPAMMALAGIYNFIFPKSFIHPRRIQKLYYSTNIESSLDSEDYRLVYGNLDLALSDWKKEEDI